MSVPTEEFLHPFAVGCCVIRSVKRQPNGEWFAQFAVDFRVKLPDGRELRIDREVGLKANPKVARKPRQKP